ncbi:hypothetical protein C8Q75DRAFT_770391 [Abortiporus biennis]|nr:hypothetical protein C8Q75DRAFT_770391 [Abortiporus biennis]
MSIRNSSPIAFPTTGPPSKKNVEIQPPPYSSSALTLQRTDVDILTKFKSFDYFKLFHLMDHIVPNHFHSQGIRFSQYKLHLLLHKIRTEILVLVGSIYYTSLRPFAMKYICNLIRRWREKYISIMEETHTGEVASDLQRTT